TLDNIIDEMTTTVEKSKTEIFHISEEADEELTQLERELVETKEKVKQHIAKGDKLEKEVRKFRKRLSVVSRDFTRFTEEDIRTVYDKTHRLQTELAIVQQEERALRLKRDELDQRILRIRR